MLWGSITQAAHAVDAWRGPVIDDHRRLMNFAYSLETEIGDPSFRFVLRSASSLHHNFYVPVDTVEEIERLLSGIQAATTDIRWPCCPTKLATEWVGSELWCIYPNQH